MTTIFLALFLAAATDIPLPAPVTQGGAPLMTALAKRQTSRSFDAKALPTQLLSNLLWAAYGINRPATGQRTAPSAHNHQEIDVYVLLPAGAYLYRGKPHDLQSVAAADLRHLAGTQDFVATAPVNLVYVEDTAKGGGGQDAAVWAGVSAGAIAQNVYLFCASEGLATVVRGSVDRSALAKALSLRPTQRIVVAQTVGFPK